MYKTIQGRLLRFVGGLWGVARHTPPAPHLRPAPEAASSQGNVLLRDDLKEAVVRPAVPSQGRISGDSSVETPPGEERECAGATQGSGGPAGLGRATLRDAFNSAHPHRCEMETGMEPLGPAVTGGALDKGVWNSVDSRRASINYFFCCYHLIRVPGLG